MNMAETKFLKNLVLILCLSGSVMFLFSFLKHLLQRFKHFYRI